MSGNDEHEQRTGMRKGVYRSTDSVLSAARFEEPASKSGVGYGRGR